MTTESTQAPSQETVRAKQKPVDKTTKQGDVEKTAPKTAEVAKPEGAKERLASERNRLRYFERKRMVLVREKKNYTQLIFMESSGTWVKAFSHSAIIFVQKIASAIGSKARLVEDRDFEVRSDTGVVSIPNVEILIEKLKKIGIELIEKKEGVYTFSLGYRIPADEYNLMRQQNQTIIERTGKMALPTVLMPELLEDIKELFRTTFWEIRNMDGAVRELIGKDMVKTAQGMVVKYVVMSRDPNSDVKAYLKEAIEDIERFNGLYFVLDSLRIVNEKKMFEIASQTLKVRKQVIYEMKRWMSKNVDAEIEGKLK